MKLEVDFSKRGVLTVLGIVLIVAGIFGVIAYGTSEPIKFGHTASEIEGLDGLVGGNVEVAQAYRNALSAPVMVQGPSSAIAAVDNVAALSELTGSSLDGLKCTDGWKLTGCWIARSGVIENTDIAPYLNGCVSNELDKTEPPTLSITCVRGSSGDAGNTGNTENPVSTEPVVSSGSSFNLLSSQISFNGPSSAYASSNWEMRDVSSNIPDGAKFAYVFISGKGKSCEINVRKDSSGGNGIVLTRRTAASSSGSEPSTNVGFIPLTADRKFEIKRTTGNCDLEYLLTGYM